MRSQDRGVGAARATFSGLCAILVGIGLARFAYTPLIPALIAAEWFAPADVVYLGAANLAGYLAGALMARAVATRVRAAVVLRAMMALASAGFFACAFPLSFLWFFVWRFAAGVAGGLLMALAAPTVLPRVSPFRRGLAGGVIFTGVGLGVAASATLVPLLLRWGLVATWCGLGAVALLLTAVTWSGWPEPLPGDNVPPPPTSERPRRSPLTLRALYVEYGLNAAGLVPHMVFLVDFVARGLEQGLEAGARYWVLFGVGAIVGPVVSGRLADRIGFRPALRLAFGIQAVGVAMVAVTVSPATLIVSSVIAGGFTSGVVPLALGRVHELLPGEARGQRTAWGFATASFALWQAASAYGYSFLFARTGSYATLFALGAAMLVLALAVDVLVAAITARAPADRLSR